MNDAQAFGNRVAIVTGGASGIGRAICMYLERCGTTVVVADRNGERAQEVAEHLQASGGRGRAATVDVALREEVDGLIHETVSQEGRIDYLFNNAGVGVNGERNRNLESRGSFSGPEACIAQIMRGVRRNRNVIIAPGRQRLFWLISRAVPSLMPYMIHRLIGYVKQNAAADD